MKKQIIIGITVTVCIALCAAVWPKSVEVEGLPVEPSIPAVNSEIEARSEETPENFLSVDTPTPEDKVVTESEPKVPEIAEEEKTQKSTPTQTVQPAKPTISSTEPHMGDVRVVNGEKQIYILGFGWIKDEGGGNTGTVAEDMYENGNKIGVIGGGTTVHGKGDINKQVGVMGSEDAPKESAVPPSTQPEPTGEVICVELQSPVTKNNTPPSYKPNGEPTNP